LAGKPARRTAPPALRRPPDWFAQLGFRLEPEANPEAYYFRVLLDDAQWESLINEALAADTYYRQRDAS
jgi:hypothetical protein